MQVARSKNINQLRQYSIDLSEQTGIKFREIETEQEV